MAAHSQLASHLISSYYYYYLIFILFTYEENLTRDIMTDSLLARLEKSSILGAISTDKRPGDEYSKAGHPSLQTTEGPATELNDLYDVLNRVNEKTGRNKSKQDTLAAYQRAESWHGQCLLTEHARWWL